MGSSLSFLDVFALEPAAAAGVSFARFVELALYHPEVGYYTAPRRRVGRDRKADFFTATTFSPVFGELVVAAAAGLLREAGKDPAAHAFVEVGAEPQGGALREVAHPFREYRTISLGQPLTVEGDCVLFSNELFDAQPFHCVARRREDWRELGVALRDGQLEQVDLPDFSPEVAAVLDRLPRDAAENYHIDLPLRTVPMIERLVTQPWRGLFLAFDYGKTWEALATEHPQGTARTYSHQRMGGDLLKRPGEIDLTCHICWDWLVDALQSHGFGEALVESQEAFFAKRAGPALAQLVAAEARTFSPRKQALMQLMHPAHMGQKFQALHALRT